jgi:hypothetical protein
MDYFAKEFLVLLKIMSVLVENIRGLDTKELSVIDVELK